MRYVKIGALALALILLGTVVFLIVSDRVGQPAPPDTASLIATAGQYHVRIKRDTFGVPHVIGPRDADVAFGMAFANRKSTRLNSSHLGISYAVFCLKKK